MLQLHLYYTLQSSAPWFHGDSTTWLLVLMWVVDFDP